jgi:regulator of sigma E protease
MTTSIFAFVIVLGVLIFFHELGHFLVARLFGVGVQTFSLGFGPRLIGKKVGITDYRLSAIPLGGFVKMVGEEPDAELTPEEVPLSFTHKHVLKKIFIVAAGPFFNLLLAVIIFYVIFQVSGLYTRLPFVGSVEPETPAYMAGLQEGDKITAINDIPVESWDEMAEIISESQGDHLFFNIIRNGETIRIGITPEPREDKNLFGENITRYVIGITSSTEVVTRKLNPFEAFSESILQTYRITELTIVSIGKLIQGTLSTKTLGGPIMIADLAGQQAREGALNLVFFTALLSINLAILNFLPIPVLDGGHLVFFFVELVTGKPVNIKVREIAQQAGIFILILLMVFVFYNDITRYIFN